ncbi:hypothetical protein L486_04392 [Kwoniella mangroviensis CBS 10435]|uniref:Anaphase-promoting complex subunit 5 n=1 Tax=Kwoniella mangroviensis CBS 10435 TaxID=1331196 RepID=A0A1B9IS58_9TREE|nr:uncharacterized protein I203_02516 [Kwoniella mangroviensis CBS 8507]OCF58359.1 hypothetical protein L486_04392 [Kwoniella mangroviensis CBS 10435]OCF67860.1 hypothetical protein I203_02516 [Kwoniella mangroviensis CBS 8507]
MKRRKLSPELYQVSNTPPLPPSSPHLLPDSALLYHFALSAHRASHQHLQQAFIHPSISADPNLGIPIAPVYNRSAAQPFIHDPYAAAKALDLQLVALDFLRAGLAYPDLSERERVAFGLEFGIVGLKFYTACTGNSTGKGKDSEKNQRVDLSRLIGDIQDVIGHSAEAYAKRHFQIVRLAALTKARFIFVYRRWELAAQALSAFSSVIGLTEDLSKPLQLSGQGNDRIWEASFIIHYLILRTLWEGRIGNDLNAKYCLKHIYALMDETAESGLFNLLRANGGVLNLNIPGGEPIQVQVTPPNILYMLTYFTTVVSRRDFTGSNQTCKTILHSNALRLHENAVRAEDMWDTGFSHLHGIGQTEIQQKEVMIIRGEMMIEHATALMFRSEFEGSYKLLMDTVDHLRINDLFRVFAPHLCLLVAQYAMLIGIKGTAAKYYEACRRLINQGSEFGLIADIGLMGSQHRLTKLLEHPENREKVHVLAEKCKGSTSAMFNGAGYLLASLIDENVVNSKKQLSNAYEISVRSNNNILRLLIFAFTTSTHHYGGRERMYRQLETGKELAKLMGGKDRPDSVGQVILGLWFAYRIKEYYRQEGDQERAGQARDSIKAHLDRLTEIKTQGLSLERMLLPLPLKA